MGFTLPPMPNGISSDAPLLTGATLAERVQLAANKKGITSPSELHRGLWANGHKVSKPTITNIWGGRTESPELKNAKALADFLEVPLDELRFGPREGDDYFVVQIRALVPDLGQHQRDQLLYLANDMAAETRARRDAPIEDAFTELVRRAAEQGPELVQRLSGLLEQLAPSPTAPAAPTARAAATPRRVSPKQPSASRSPRRS